MSEPWRHMLRWRDVSSGPARLRLQADDTILEQIAQDLDLPAVQRLAADLTLRPWLYGVEIEGRISALVTQTCGVSLDDFDAEVEDAFSVRVVPAGSPNAPGGETPALELDPDADDPPDVAQGEGVDLAAYVVEHLALAFDPFPRKPGVAFEAPKDEGPISPFAVLKALKDPPPEG